MSEISDKLFEQVAAIGKQVELPPVQSFVFPPVDGPPGRRNNFAYLRLADDTTGLTYVALDDAIADLAIEIPRLNLAGTSPVKLATRYLAGEGWKRSLGLSAINAISQFLLRRFEDLGQMPANVEMLSPVPGERIGMVGYFGRVVDPLRARNIPVTVIELDESLLRDEPGLEVTLDVSRLRGCSQVIITGTTLLNHSIDRLLPFCSEAQDVHLLGPTASCLPDVLFDAGITSVGGFQVTEAGLFAQRWAEGGRWRDAGRRYTLTRSTYPGLDALLAR